MAYAYFRNLSKAQKKIYQASNKVHALPIDTHPELHLHTTELSNALKLGNVIQVEMTSQNLIDALFEQLDVAKVHVHVLERRPHNQYGELHGLYEPIDEDRLRARIYVWMRTAKQERIVAFKTFLRTLLHEACHHLDYEYLQLEDSLHTEGFYKRESSLYRQLVK